MIGNLDVVTMELQLAWRNIWRNPRRTAVILTAVIIGVWSMVGLGALMRGILIGMIQNNIDTLTGHIQIHQQAYPDDPAIEHSISDPETWMSAARDALPAGSRWSQRIRIGAVVSNARHTRGAILMGIDPAAEARLSFIGTAVTEGAYLADGDTGGILIGRALAQQFDTRLGRKLILTAQDSDGEIVSRAFRIRGIYQAEMADTEKGFLFVNRQSAQQLLKLGNRISEIAIRLPAHEMAVPVANDLKARLAGSPLRVRAWPEILPLLKAYVEMFDTFILIWFIVVFVAMGFGILNTTLMAVFERMREFGVLKALGMRPGRIVRGVLLETLLMLVLGIGAGNLLGLATCWGLSITGIDLSAMAEGVAYAGMARIITPVVWIRDLLRANLVVLLLGLLVCLYPAIKAARMTPVAAMRHH
ncbi:MAG: ABC transporter permease [Desulfosarcinaceae bacterium]|nr:ABC transporter permease [Desulfosarcinaceae bacterium]